MAIDALCQQAAEEKRVDVFRYVNNARHQRTHLVQTLVSLGDIKVLTVKKNTILLASKLKN